MSLLHLWWATGSANCSVWCNNHIQLQRMGSDTWNHYTHTLSHSLTHHDAIYTKTASQGTHTCVRTHAHMLRVPKSKMYQSQVYEHGSKKTVILSLRRWVFIPLVWTEIYKTLTPANPAATKTGEGQQGTRNVLPKHTNKANYTTVAL